MIYLALAVLKTRKIPPFYALFLARLLACSKFMTLLKKPTLAIVGVFSKPNSTFRFFSRFDTKFQPSPFCKTRVLNQEQSRGSSRFAVSALFRRFLAPFQCLHVPFCKRSSRMCKGILESPAFCAH